MTTVKDNWIRYQSTWRGQHEDPMAVLLGIMADYTRKPADGAYKIGNHTSVSWWKHADGWGDVSVRFHETDVLTYTTTGHLIINTGGYNTRSTKDRINYWLPKHLMVDGSCESGWTGKRPKAWRDWALMSVEHPALLTPFAWDNQRCEVDLAEWSEQRINERYWQAVSKQQGGE